MKRDKTRNEGKEKGLAKWSRRNRWGGTGIDQSYDNVRRARGEWGSAAAPDGMRWSRIDRKGKMISRRGRKCSPQSTMRHGRREKGRDLPSGADGIGGTGLASTNRKTTSTEHVGEWGRAAAPDGMRWSRIDRKGKMISRRGRRCSPQSAIRHGTREKGRDLPNGADGIGGAGLASTNQQDRPKGIDDFQEGQKALGKWDARIGRADQRRPIKRSIHEGRESMGRGCCSRRNATTEETGGKRKRIAKQGMGEAGRDDEPMRGKRDCQLHNGAKDGIGATDIGQSEALHKKHPLSSSEGRLPKGNPISEKYPGGKTDYPPNLEAGSSARLRNERYGCHVIAKQSGGTDRPKRVAAYVARGGEEREVGLGNVAAACRMRIRVIGWMRTNRNAG
ncbi:hypothetical protein BJ322DRAFT_1025100 [Thelephora terrestris]|uniref:Uncharacterized protein n=1 Tax=Thelephora terrestris TaxID=56493 RepID=A0A9P6L1F3_9AGAM|nr:hypothetical protein BJ322DRAFT_1025100 [Thelephora terrestris]